MCGRYAVTLPPDAMRSLFATEGPLPNVPPRGNAAPTQMLPAVRLGEGRRELVLLRWGLVPAWSKAMTGTAPLINARADGVATKPSFRDAFRKRRCLVPADGFYEWQPPGKGAKQPWFVRLKGGATAAFAGIWERWQAPDGSTVESMAIITTDAPELIRPIHDRMPVMLPAEAWELWLDPRTPPAVAEALLVPVPSAALEAFPVSTRVNAVANDDVSLCIPWDEAAAAQAAPEPTPQPAQKKPPAQGSLF